MVTEEAEATAMGFGRAGTALWEAVTKGYELDPAERAVLAQACRTVDELARLDVELVDVPMMVSGSMGQPVPNPLLAEARAHRKVLESLTRSLALPLEGEEEGQVRHPQQRQAVRYRHRISSIRPPRGQDDGEA